MAPEPIPEISFQSVLKIVTKLGVEDAFQEMLGKAGPEFRAFAVKASQGKASQADFEEVFDSVNAHVDGFVQRSIPAAHPDRDRIGAVIKDALKLGAINAVPSALMSRFTDTLNELSEKGAFNAAEAKSAVAEFFAKRGTGK